MPSNRTFHPDEQARRDAYEHTDRKDSNFNPMAKLKAEMTGPLRGQPQKAMDMMETQYTSDRVPRRGE